MQCNDLPYHDKDPGHQLLHLECIPAYTVQHHEQQDYGQILDSAEVEFDGA